MRAVRLVLLVLCLAVSANAATFTVTNTNDSGAGSLRQAILDANAAAGTDTIVFAIGSGPQLITPATPLPAVTGAVTIDATTQPGYSGTPLIGIDGGLILGNGSFINAGLILNAPATVLGFAITGFRVPNYNDGGEGAGIVIDSTGCVVKRCYLGLSRTGTAGPNDSGIRISGNGGGTIGAPGEGNVMSANGRLGIAIWFGSKPVTIQNNIVGLDPTGTTAIPNQEGMFLTDAVTVLANLVAGNTYENAAFTGNGAVVKGNKFGVNAFGTIVRNSYGPNVMVYHGFAQSASATIGGPSSSDWNEIAGAYDNGLWIYGAANVVVQGNRIHHNFTGVYLEQSTGTLVVSNAIHDNNGVGVRVVSGAGNRIQQNAITNNYGGIQLGTSIPLPNDPGDGDTGANLGQNFPVLTSASALNGTITLTGSLNSTPNATFRVEFFETNNCDSNGYGEGGTYFTATNVTTDPSGHADINLSVPGILGSGHVVTATATDASGNTSEFSACVPVQGAGAFAMASSTLNAGEAAGSVSVTVVRTNGTSIPATVDYATASGTATAGSDFTATSGTLAFAAGETAKTFSIPILNDTVYEGNETFTVSLSNPTAGTTLGLPSTTTITIIDDEKPPTLDVADIRVTEGNSGTTPATFTLTLDRPGPQPITISYYTSSGSASSYSDFLYASGNVTFNPGETQKSVVVQVYGDTVYEPDETFYLSLNTYSGVTLARTYAVCTIVNDDVRPMVTADDVRVVEGTSGNTVAAIILRATQPVYGYVDFYTVDGSAVAGRDYTYTYGSVFFNNEAQKTFFIPIIGDSEVEPDEQFTVHLSTYSGFGLSKSDVAVTIANDDAGVGPSTQNVAKGSSGMVVIDVGNPSLTPQTITVAATDPCIKAPATVEMGYGVHTVSFQVAAVSAPCSARVDVTLPPALGGKTMSAGIRTYLPATVTFTPSNAVVFIGQTLTAKIALSPLDAPIALQLQALGGTAEVPDSVNVDANGGTFTIKGLKTGPLVVNVTLPAINGGGIAALYGDVIEAPKTVTITGVSPVSGPTAGGTSVTLSGANFAASCTVSFGGVPATSVAFGSALSMTAISPAHAAGTVDVSVSCGTDAFTLANAFTYATNGPALSSVSPSFGSTAGGTAVRITGRDFQPSCWPFFDSAAARSVSVVSPTEIIATTPPHAAGSVTLSLRCGASAGATLDDAFSYSTAAEPSPVITSVDPRSGAPGQLVTIAGTRFRTSDVVTFDAAVAPLLSTTPDAHVVAVPNLPLGKVSVNVTDASGHVSTTGPIFTVLEPSAPKVTKISPASVPAGAELTLDGTGFRPPYGFTIGGAAARIVTMSPSRAIVRVPAVPAGAQELDVVNGNGDVSSIGGNVTIASSGVVASGASPACLPTAGGTTLTISGSGFATGATVTVGGVAATNVVVVDAAHLTLTLPALPPGFATVVVTNPNGDYGTATNAVRIYSPFDPDGCGVPPRARPVHR